MGSDKFRNTLIYENLKDEFRIKLLNFNFPLTDSKAKTVWNRFIESKDLGIISLSYYDDEYRITDEKKWTLAKIKYGI